jgi:hypothetical protein
VLSNGGTVARFTLDANGTIKIIKLGNIGSAAARFVLQAGGTVSGLPELWGVAKIQANLDFLKNYGIFVEGSAMLQLNTTPTPKTETISLEGIPGDVIQKNLSSAIGLSGLSTSVLGEVTLPTTWTADLATALSVVDFDRGIDGIQYKDKTDGSIKTIDLAGAKVQTIIRGQQYKIITRDAANATKFGPTYFLEFDTKDNKFDLLAEGQTFELPAQSFSIEIVGSLKIKANGSSDENADDAVRLFGGFFLRITPRFRCSGSTARRSA